MNGLAPSLLTRFLTLLLFAGLIVSNSACSSSKTEETPADASRVSDVMKISYQIAMFKVRNDRIPQNLAETNQEGEWKTPVDPVSGKPYEYKVLDKNRYELCATFDKAIESREGELPGITYGDGLAHGYGYWIHGGGRQCVQRTLN